MVSKTGLQRRERRRKNMFFQNALKLNAIAFPILQAKLNVEVETI